MWAWRCCAWHCWFCQEINCRTRQMFPRLISLEYREILSPRTSRCAFCARGCALRAASRCLLMMDGPWSTALPCATCCTVGPIGLAASTNRCCCSRASRRNGYRLCVPLWICPGPCPRTSSSWLFCPRRRFHQVSLWMAKTHVGRATDWLSRCGSCPKIKFRCFDGVLALAFNSSMLQTSPVTTCHTRRPTVLLTAFHPTRLWYLSKMFPTSTKLTRIWKKWRAVTGSWSSRPTRKVVTLWRWATWRFAWPPCWQKQGAPFRKHVLFTIWRARTTTKLWSTVEFQRLRGILPWFEIATATAINILFVVRFGQCASSSGAGVVLRHLGQRLSSHSIRPAPDVSLRDGACSRRSLYAASDHTNRLFWL